MCTGLNVDVDDKEAPFTKSPSNTTEIKTSKASPRNADGSTISMIEEGYSEQVINDNELTIEEALDPSSEVDLKNNKTLLKSDVNMKEQNTYAENQLGKEVNGNQRKNGRSSLLKGSNSAAIYNSDEQKKQSKTAHDKTYRSAALLENKQYVGGSSGLVTCESFFFHLIYKRTFKLLQRCQISKQSTWMANSFLSPDCVDN